jgi:hypothetical protein
MQHALVCACIYQLAGGSLRLANKGSEAVKSAVLPRHIQQLEEDDAQDRVQPLQRYIQLSTPRTGDLPCRT